jgi:hypothetical protein
MMRVFYELRSGHAHRYPCRGDDAHVGGVFCIGIGGVRVDRPVVIQILEAVFALTVEAAIPATEQVMQTNDYIRQVVVPELDEARHEVSLAVRRYEVVDPTKRLIARELEARWNVALEPVTRLEQHLGRLNADVASRPQIDRASLLEFGHDLPAAWNAHGTDARTEQLLTRILIQEVVIDLDDSANEAVVTAQWNDGRHTEIRVARVRNARYPEDRHPNLVEVIRGIKKKTLRKCCNDPLRPLLEWLFIVATAE